MKRGALAALALLASGCASFTTYSSARTLPAGHSQFFVAASGNLSLGAARLEPRASGILGVLRLGIWGELRPESLQAGRGERARAAVPEALGTNEPPRSEPCPVV